MPNRGAWVGTLFHADPAWPGGLDAGVWSFFFPFWDAWMLMNLLDVGSYMRGQSVAFCVPPVAIRWGLGRFMLELVRWTLVVWRNPEVGLLGSRSLFSTL